VPTKYRNIPIILELKKKIEIVSRHVHWNQEKSLMEETGDENLVTLPL
jgi:hypothetical protein